MRASGTVQGRCSRGGTGDFGNPSDVRILYQKCRRIADRIAGPWSKQSPGLRERLEEPGHEPMTVPFGRPEPKKHGVEP